MYAPRFFVSMTGVLLVFAGVTYWMTGSVYTTILQTVICAVILQVGYFIGVLYLVRREMAERRNSSSEAAHNQRSSDARGSDNMPADAAPQLEITDR